MPRFWGATAIVALIAVGQSQAAGKASPGEPPAADKQKLEKYLRYAEGFASSVKIQIEDPKTTSVKGYYRLIVHLSMGETKQDKVYYLTADGQHLLAGQVWALNQSPFEETINKIPVEGPSFGPPDAPLTLVVFSDFQ